MDYLSLYRMKSSCPDGRQGSVNTIQFEVIIFKRFRSASAPTRRGRLNRACLPSDEREPYRELRVISLEGNNARCNHLRRKVACRTYLT